jgi:hypothetical protein
MVFKATAIFSFILFVMFIATIIYIMRHAGRYK